MTAIACVRIMIDPAKEAAGGEKLALLVGRVANAFLETRWRWPRRHGEIAPYAFLLADPKATRLPANELVALSEELHIKLFGAGDGGAVSLAMLEGEQDAVTRFAAVDSAELRRILLEGGEIDGLSGRISQITPQGVRVVSPPKEAGPLVSPPPPVEPGPRRRTPVANGDVEVSFTGVWCALKASFIGSGLTARRKGLRGGAYSIVDGVAVQPGDDAVAFDKLCLESAPRALIGSQGLLFLPISFSSAIHRPSREHYLRALEALPQAFRPRLAAVVYDVPRAPSFTAVTQLKAFLHPYFGFVDLQTADPNFQIDTLMSEAVNSVTLSLPDIDEGGRLAAATRFMASRDAYQRRHIWPAITNVRTRRELGFCVKMRVPFLSGRAISDILVAPADPVQIAAERLPIREPILIGDAQPGAQFNAMSG